MDSFSIWHWVIVLCAIALLGIPVVRILRRAGFSGWLALLWFVPLVNVVALWVFAFAPWKTDAARTRQT
ncbi:MAG: hypothetical protein ABW360_06470 [Phenylobacterium sp.]